MTRRDALALLLGVPLAACSRAHPTGDLVRAPPASTLRLGSMVDLVQAAGLVWLVELRPRELASSPIFASTIATVIPDARFDGFARGHGGVDLRRLDELVIAAYARASLALGRGSIDPDAVAAAFAARADDVATSTDGEVRRSRGTVRGDTEEVALLARDCVVLERGQSGPLRAAVYFAEQRLHRSLPALRAEPLTQAAALLGPAPIRGFAPGPFEGEWGRGVGGLLRATTAVAAFARVSEIDPARGIDLRVLLTGAWGADARAAAERLGSAFDVLTSDPLGRLTGVDRPLEGPSVRGDPAALRLDVTLEASSLARGLHAAGDASLAEIMAY